MKAVPKLLATVVQTTKSDRSIKMKIGKVFCLKSTLAYLFSTFGLSFCLICYLAAGGWLFRFLEASHEQTVTREMSTFREDSLEKLWNLTASMNVLHPPNWTAEATEIFETYTRGVYEFTKKLGWDGSEIERRINVDARKRSYGDYEDGTIDEPQWSMAGAVLYSVTVITTIGYGHIAPRTDIGRAATIIYALIGIPLSLLTISNYGKIMASTFKIVYTKLCQIGKRATNIDSTTELGRNVRTIRPNERQERIIDREKGSSRKKKEELKWQTFYNNKLKRTRNPANRRSDDDLLNAGTLFPDCELKRDSTTSENGESNYFNSKNINITLLGDLNFPEFSDSNLKTAGKNGSLLLNIDQTCHTDLISTKKSDISFAKSYDEHLHTNDVKMIHTKRGNINFPTSDNCKETNDNCSQEFSKKKIKNNKKLVEDLEEVKKHMNPSNKTTIDTISERNNSSKKTDHLVKKSNHLKELKVVFKKNNLCFSNVPIFKGTTVSSLKNNTPFQKIDSEILNREENGRINQTDDKAAFQTRNKKIHCINLQNSNVEGYKDHAIEFGYDYHADKNEYITGASAEKNEYITGESKVVLNSIKTSTILKESIKVNTNSQNNFNIPENEIRNNENKQVCNELILHTTPNTEHNNAYESIVLNSDHPQKLDFIECESTVNPVNKFNKSKNDRIGKRSEKRDEKVVVVPIYIGLSLMTGYICSGALLFSLMEDWDYLIGCYFCFVTISTIGFGDFVPGTGSEKVWNSSQFKLILCAFYLLFGLSLMAMCFELMQEQAKATFKSLARKLGLVN